MKDLGVTHVQLLPIFDYASVNEEKVNEPQYNWGYDPKTLTFQRDPILQIHMSQLFE